MQAQKTADGRWVGRYKTPDGRHHRTSAHRTARAERDSQHAYAFCEGDEGDLYYVGRYPTPAGWRETEHGFDTEAEALAEAQELEQAAHVGVQREA